MCLSLQAFVVAAAGGDDEGATVEDAEGAQEEPMKAAADEDVEGAVPAKVNLLVAGRPTTVLTEKVNIFSFFKSNGTSNKLPEQQQRQAGGPMSSMPEPEHKAAPHTDAADEDKKLCAVLDSQKHLGDPDTHVAATVPPAEVCDGNGMRMLGCAIDRPPHNKAYQGQIDAMDAARGTPGEDESMANLRMRLGLQIKQTKPLKYAFIIIITTNKR